MTKNLRDEQTKSAHLNTLNSRLDGELKDCKTQLQSQRIRLLKNADNDSDSKIAMKNVELNKYMAEIQMLSTENATLSTDFAQLTEELDAAIKKIDLDNNVINNLNAIVEQNSIDMGYLKIERDDLVAKLQDVSDNEKRNISDITHELQSTQSELSHTKSTIKNLQLENHNLQSVMLEYRSEMAEAQKAMKQSADYNTQQESKHKDKYINELKSKLSNLTSNFEILSKDWERLDKLVKTSSNQDLISKVQEGIKEKSKMQGLIAAYQEQQKVDLAAFRKLEQELLKKDEQLNNCFIQIQKYQSSYGIEEAVKEMAKLNAQRIIDKNDINQLKCQVSDFQNQLNELAEENTVLYSKLDKKLHPSVKVDISNLSTTKSIELEQERALNLRLRQEIDSMEEERLQLKHSLRLQALERGERAVSFGLEPSDLIKLEKFAESLRLKQPFKDNDTHLELRHDKVNDNMATLIQEIEKYHVEIKQASIKIENLQNQIKDTESLNHRLELAVMEISTKLVDPLNSERLNSVRELVKILSLKYGQSTLITIPETETAKVDAPEQNFEDLSSLASLPNGFNSMANQLIDCLIELEKQRKNNESLENVVRALENQYEPITEKVKGLFINHISLKNEHLLHVEGLNSTIKGLEEEQHLLKSKAVKFDELVTSLASDSATKSQLSELCRANVIMQVQYQNAQNKIKMFSLIESKLQNDNLQLKSDFNLLEKASRLRIVKMHHEQEGLRSTIETLQTKLSDTVPKSTLTLMESKLEATVNRMKSLLDFEQRILQDSSFKRDFIVESKKLEKLLQDSKINITKYKEQFDEIQKNAVEGQSNDLNMKMLEERAKIAEHARDMLLEREAKLIEQLGVADQTYFDCKEQEIKLKAILEGLWSDGDKGAFKLQYEKALDDLEQSKQSGHKKDALIEKCKMR